MVSGQGLVDPCDRVVWEAGGGVGETGVRIDAVELGGLDQSGGGGGGTAAGLRADEEGVRPTEGDAAPGTFGWVVVDLRDAVAEGGPEARQAGKGMADRGGLHPLKGSCPRGSVVGR